MIFRTPDNRKSLSKQEGSDDSGMPQASSTQYMVETELLGVIAILPLSCRDVIFSQRGLVAQLALIALMEKEKYSKNYARVKRASKRNHWLVKRLLRRLQPKAKHKIKRKVLKKAKQRSRRSLFSLFKTRRRSKKIVVKKVKKNTKSASKKVAKKKQRLKRLKVGVKLVKRSIRKARKTKIGSQRVKRSPSATKLSKLSTKTKVVGGKVVVKKQQASKAKGKPFFLKKPGAKDIDKFKKLVAKKVKAKAFQKSVQSKKMKLRAKDDESKARQKGKSTFFKASSTGRSSAGIVGRQRSLK